MQQHLKSLQQQLHRTGRSVTAAVAAAMTAMAASAIAELIATLLLQ